MADAPRQKCPNCERTHDVSVYVSGQKVRCSCGLHFEVRRPDVRPTIPPSSGRVMVRATEPTAVRPSLEPVPAEATLPPTPQTPPKGPTRPDRIGPPQIALAQTAVLARPEIPGYELVELLGKGGMGEVWRGKQLSLGRVVAIKILAQELAGDAEFVQRFQKEAAALAALSHPNIVQIIDRGGDGASRLFFFAMEMCEGSSLRELLTTNALGLGERLRLVVQIGQAIGYAHERGVIHRDLKPENILVDSSKNAKVVDFGLAGMRHAQAQLNLTRAATAMGTLHYMAPEQRRDARSVDERADVYSLGVILYELLTGDLPMGRFKLPSERVPGLDTRLDKIVSKALEPEPEARYPGAKEMVAELEAVLATIPPTTTQSEATQVDGPPSDARTWIARVLAALAVVALLLLGAWALAGRFNEVDGAAKVPPVRPTTVSLDSLPPDTNGEVMVTSTLQPGDLFVLDVGFKPGAQALKAGTGSWRLQDEVLQARVFGTGRSGARPFAVLDGPVLLAQGLVITAAFTVDLTTPQGYTPVEQPRAELMLRGEQGARLSVAARYGRPTGFSLVFRPPGGESVEEHRLVGEDDPPVRPSPGRPLLLRLAESDGEVEVLAGEQEPLKSILKTRLDVGAVQGRVALGCVEATCRFSRLEVVARPLVLDKPPAPLEPQP